FAATPALALSIVLTTLSAFAGSLPAIAAARGLGRGCSRCFFHGSASTRNPVHEALEHAGRTRCHSGLLGRCCRARRMYRCRLRGCNAFDERLGLGLGFLAAVRRPGQLFFWLKHELKAGLDVVEAGIIMTQ